MEWRIVRADLAAKHKTAVHSGARHGDVAEVRRAHALRLARAAVIVTAMKARRSLTKAHKHSATRT